MYDRGIFGGDSVNDVVLLSALDDEDEDKGGGCGSPSGCFGGKNWLIAGVVIFGLYMVFGGGK
jgi:hypothetical protein